MKLILPDNVFGRLIQKNLPAPMKNNVVFQPSSLLTSKLVAAENSVALIPTLDLIKNKELYVSKSFGISFEGSLCNSYLYFGREQKEIKRVNLYGDVSSVEAVLCKLLFMEIYNTEIEVGINAAESRSANENLLVAGDSNFRDLSYQNGISFAEEIEDSFGYPFVNYILASGSESLIKEANNNLEGTAERVYGTVSENIAGEKFPGLALAYITENISSLILDFEEQDIEGINQLIRLPYFHGMIDDIVELKFV